MELTADSKEFHGKTRLATGNSRGKITQRQKQENALTDILCIIE